MKHELPETDPWEFDAELFQQYPQEAIESIRACWGRIRTHYHVGCRCSDTYVMRLEQATLREVRANLWAVLASLVYQSKVNFSFAYLLKKKDEEDVFRAFYASQNNGMFELPYSILGYDDMCSMTETFNDADVLDSIAQQLPTSKWIVVGLLSMTVFVYKTDELIT